MVALPHVSSEGWLSGPARLPRSSHTRSSSEGSRAHQARVPGAPLNGPTTSEVIQPP